MRISKTLKTLAITAIFVSGSIVFPAFGATIPGGGALYDGFLSSGISPTATSMVLTNGYFNDGTALTGWQCFTVDANSPSIEYICGNASGTAVSNLMRGIMYVNPNLSSASLEFQHGRGASVQITDYPDLQILNRLLNGTDPLLNPLTYASHPGFTGVPSTTIEDKNYIDQQIASTSYAGTVNGSTSTKGIFQEATPAQIASGTPASGSTGADLVLAVSPFNTFFSRYFNLTGGAPTVNQVQYSTSTASTTYSYSYTNGSQQTFVVPNLGLNESLQVSLSSGQGGYSGNGAANGSNTGGTGMPGAAGYKVVANLASVTPGTTYYYNIGSQAPSAGNATTGSGRQPGAAGLPGNGFGTSATGHIGNSAGASDGSSYPGPGGGGSGQGGHSWFSDTTSVADNSTLEIYGGHGASGGGGGGSSNDCYAGAGGQGGAADDGTPGGAPGSGGCSGSNGSNGTTGAIGSVAVLGSNFSSSTTATSTGNGALSLVLNYTYGTENVTSTVTGTNFAGTISVSATTMHLNPTTLTMNFTNAFLNTPSCIVTPFNQVTASIGSVSTTSVTFNFSSGMGGQKFSYTCTGN